jgi:hypothetical protein
MDGDGRLRMTAPRARNTTVATRLRPAPQLTNLMVLWLAHLDQTRRLEHDLEAVYTVCERRSVAPFGQLARPMNESDPIEEIAALARRALTVDAWMDQFSRMPTPHSPTRRLLPRVRFTKSSDVEPMLHPDDVDNRRRTLEAILARVNVLQPEAQHQMSRLRSTIVDRLEQASKVNEHDPVWYHLGSAEVGGIDVRLGWCPSDGPLVLACSDGDEAPAQVLAAAIEAANSNSSRPRLDLEVVRVEADGGPEVVESNLVELATAPLPATMALVIDATDVDWARSIFLRTHPAVIDCGRLRASIGVHIVEVVLDCPLGERGAVDA